VILFFDSYSFIFAIAPSLSSSSSSIIMAYDDSEDDLDMSFSSIHDLDHAPEPPPCGGGLMAPRSYSPRGGGGHHARPSASASATSGGQHRPRSHAAGILVLPDHPLMASGGAHPQTHLHHSLVADPYQYGSHSPGGGSTSAGSASAAAMMPMAPRGRHRTASMNMYLLPTTTHQPTHYRDRASSDSYNNNNEGSSSSMLQYSAGGGGRSPSSYSSLRGGGASSSRRTVGFSDDDKHLLHFPAPEDDGTRRHGMEHGEGGGSSTGFCAADEDDAILAAAAAASQYGDLLSNSVTDSTRRLQLEKERLDSLDDSSANDHTNNGGEGGEQNASESGGGDDVGDSQATPTMFLGFQVPRYCCAWRPDRHKIATFVVTRAPCFCCMGFRQPTDRAILARLNILVAFFALVQIASTSFLAVVTFSSKLVDRTLETQTEAEIEAANQETPASAVATVWTLNGYMYMLAILAFVMLNASICTVRIIQNVNLVGAIRYL
jgi:hypothetical protein